MKKKFKDCGTEKIGFFFKGEKKILFGSLVIPCGFLKLYNVCAKHSRVFNLSKAVTCELQKSKWNSHSKVHEIF